MTSALPFARLGRALGLSLVGLAAVLSSATSYPPLVNPPATTAVALASCERADLPLSIETTPSSNVVGVRIDLGATGSTFRPPPEVALSFRVLGTSQTEIGPFPFVYDATAADGGPTAWSGSVEATANLTLRPDRTGVATGGVVVTLERACDATDLDVAERPPEELVITVVATPVVGEPTTVTWTQPLAAED